MEEKEYCEGRSEVNMEEKDIYGEGAGRHGWNNG